MRACGRGRTGEARQPASGGRSNLSASLARRRLGSTRIGANRRVRTLETRKNLRKASYADRRAGVARGATRRATVAGRVSGHAPVESSSPQGPVISPTPSRGPRRARHSASAGLSGVTVRLPSPWRSEDATPLDELPPPAPPAPPPPPPAPRGPELPPLDIVFRRFTRRKPPPPPRGYACPVSDCHHGKILSFGAKRGAENQSENNSREGRLQVEASPQTGAHTKSRKLPIRRFLLSTSTVAGARRPPLASTRRARLRVCLRSVAMVLRNALARAAAPLRGAAQAQLSSAGVIGTLAPLARAGAPRHYRNPVENELYDRSRQEYSLGNRVPSVAADAWVAPNATLIGDADIADQCSVWHGAVLKGDLGPVRLGAFSNVQERCVIDAAGCVERIPRFSPTPTFSARARAPLEKPRWRGSDGRAGPA